MALADPIAARAAEAKNTHDCGTVALVVPVRFLEDSRPLIERFVLALADWSAQERCAAAQGGVIDPSPAVIASATVQQTIDLLAHIAATQPF